MRLIRSIAALALGLTASTSSAMAESWPAKPLRAIIPFAAGSITDIVPRIVLERLSVQLGQPVVVENRSGGAQTIGANAVAKAEPDGYTLLLNSSAHVIAPSLNPNLGYDPVKDFASIIPLGVVPSVLVTSPTKGFKTVSDLVAAAKARPGSMNFASAGVGTATHLGAMRFQASAGIEAVHIPFKGGTESITETLSGRVDFFLAPVGVALPHVKAGTLVPLVVNSAKRSSALPDVPTTAEAGFRNAEYPFWIGMFVPAKTPRSVVETLHRETLKALQDPKVREKFAEIGVDAMIATPEEFDAQVRQEITANAELIKAIGLKTQ